MDTLQRHRTSNVISFVLVQIHLVILTRNRIPDFVDIPMVQLQWCVLNETSGVPGGGVREGRHSASIVGTTIWDNDQRDPYCSSIFVQQIPIYFEALCKLISTTVLKPPFIFFFVGTAAAVWCVGAVVVVAWKNI